MEIQKASSFVHTTFLYCQFLLTVFLHLLFYFIIRDFFTGLQRCVYPLFESNNIRNTQDKKALENREGFDHDKRRMRIEAEDKMQLTLFLATIKPST